MEFKKIWFFSLRLDQCSNFQSFPVRSSRCVYQGTDLMQRIFFTCTYFSEGYEYGNYAVVCIVLLNLF
jgi:hypothetical protein